MTLFERTPEGTSPDGSVAGGEKLLRTTYWVEIRLEQPLGTREVLDGFTGKSARRLEPGSTRKHLEVFSCPRASCRACCLRVLLSMIVRSVDLQRARARCGGVAEAGRRQMKRMAMPG